MAASLAADDVQLIDPQRVTAKESLITRRLLAVFGASFGAMMCFYLLLSVAPLFATSVGATGMAAGMVTGVLMLATVAVELGTPRLVRQFGDRPIVAGGLLLLGIPSVAMIAAKTVGALLALSVLRGAGIAIIFVLGGAMVAASVPPSRRGAGLGLYGTVVGIPAIVGLPLGLWLAHNAGFATVFVLAGACALTGLVAIPFLPERVSTDATAASITSLTRSPALMRLAIAFSLTTIAAGVVVTFLPLAATHASANLVSIALLVQAASSTLSRWWAGIVGDRHGSGRLLYPAVVVAAIGVLSLVVASSTAMLMVGMVLFGFGFGVAQNASIVAMFDHVPDAGHDAASALWNLSYDAGLGAGAAGFGIAAARVGYEAAFGILAGVMMVGVAIVARRK
jgi:predicted MFS family arabinose efflux permease